MNFKDWTRLIINSHLLNLQSYRHFLNYPIQNDDSNFTNGIIVKSVDFNKYAVVHNILF